MRRRVLLAAAGGGLVALIGGTALRRAVPVIPRRPAARAQDALGWIAHRDGGFVLTLPQIEMGQGIATALKQVACAELGVAWNAVTVVTQDTRLPRVRATVGSESMRDFALPLARACAALREALAQCRTLGLVTVPDLPAVALRAFRVSALRDAPEIVDGRAIVTGAPLFAADDMRAGLLFGRVLRAPASVEVASRPLRWNLAAAQAVPGFVAVVVMCGPPIGQAQGLGVVAVRPDALDRVATALAVEWAIDGAPGPATVDVDVDAALAQGPLPHAVLDGLPAPGDWDVDVRIDVPLAAHAPMEPRAAVADWAGHALRVRTGTQDAFYVRDVLARAFALSPERVMVQAARVGGTFGGKTICTVEGEAAAPAKAVGVPVRVQWTLAQECALAFHRPPSSHRIRVQGGRVTDWDHAQVSSHILFTGAVVPPWMQAGTDLLAGDGGVARGMAAPYALGRARSTYGLRRLPVHTGPWRGLGAGPNGLAIELAMDAAARAAGADPLAFRLAHVTDPRLSAVLDRVAALAGWGGPATPGAAGDRTGRGIACGIYKQGSYGAVVADVAVDAAGRMRLTRIWAAHDCGWIANAGQVRAQCEGNLVWSLGMVLSDRLDIEDGRIVAEGFAEARVPRMADVSPITVDVIDSPHPPSGAGETLMADHGPLAVLRIADAVPYLPPDPVVQALTPARGPVDLLSRWSRLERFSHGRHHVIWDAQSYRITLHHIAHSGLPPAMAETLLVLAVLAMLAEGIGGLVAMRANDGRVLRSGGLWQGIAPAAPLGPVLLSVTCTTSRQPMTLPDSVDDLPALIRRRIAADPLAPCRLAALSDDIGLPPRTLQWRLAAGDTSLTALVTQARLEVAASLLCQRKGPSLAEIAFRAGYADQPHFARASHRAVGTTSAAYRAAFAG